MVVREQRACTSVREGVGVGPADGAALADLSQSVTSETRFAPQLLQIEMLLGGGVSTRSQAPSSVVYVGACEARVY